MGFIPQNPSLATSSETAPVHRPAGSPRPVNLRDTPRPPADKLPIRRKALLSPQARAKTKNMQILALKIPVRSRRQAMDWSLVLLSQEIESVIDYSQEDDTWALTVAPEHYDKALAALQQYQLENRGWAWRQTLPVPGWRFDWSCTAWLFLVLVFYWLQGQVALQPAGVMDSQAVRAGQWWRLFTAVWLHADPAHLATNSALGLVLLGLAMGRYGTGTGLLAAYLAGVGGNLLPLLLSTARHQSLGASGMIMGALGLNALSSWTHWRGDPHRTRLVLGGLGAGILLFVLLGLTPGTDILAHLGGFLSGLVAGAALSLFPRSSGPKTNLINGFLFALLVILPWCIALKTFASKP